MSRLTDPELRSTLGCRRRQVMPNLVHCLSQTLCSLAGTPRGRQDSSCLGPDLALLEATSLKGPAQEGRGAGRAFGAYHLLYLREGERTRLTCRSRAIHPALTALTACGAVCAALHGLGQPKAPQPHGVHTSNLVVSLRPCCARAVPVDSGRVPCSCWAPGSRSRFPVHGRHTRRRVCSGLCFVPAWSHICTSVTVAAADAS